MSKIGQYYLELTEADMSGDYDVLPEIGKTMPLTKAEIAFKRKFEYRVKTVVKYLGRNLLWTEFNDIHETLTKELEEVAT